MWRILIEKIDEGKKKVILNMETEMGDLVESFINWLNKSAKEYKEKIDEWQKEMGK